jgi:hypothetical protein
MVAHRFENPVGDRWHDPDADRMTGTPHEFPDARLTVAVGVDASPDVLAPLHAYALGHATGAPAPFLRAFRPTAHIEGIRDGVFVSWDLDTYCALFDGPAPDEAARSRVIDDLRVTGTVASATMTLRHGEITFTDVFLLLRDADGWQIANKVYQRDDA